MTAAIHDNRYACWNGCPADANNKGVCLFSTLADADGLRLASNTVITNINVVHTCREISTGSIAHCNVKAAGCVGIKRQIPVGSVVISGGIAIERRGAAGCVIVASSVVSERIRTVGHVGGADRIKS